ncbi:MAG: orotidine-5'-phosphate decarboxylase [Parcubacteria group bacterium]|nr:orotidine-5'-phosphate decarboxylase [Parcubacteria group bacterium]
MKDALPKDRTFVAVDVDELRKAEPLVKMLAPHVGCFKIGLELTTAVGGPQAVEFIHSLGGQVFYDGKFCDIPNTVGRAAKAVSALGVKMFNVHASAGVEAMAAAVKNKGNSLVLAVTLLTSLNEDDINVIFGGPSKTKVLQLARDAMRAGCDGVICSPQELTFLRSHTDLQDFSLITPGVRPAGTSKQDQKRVMTPYEAIMAGADALVIGRPITEDKDPVSAAQRIEEEVRRACQEKSV